MLDLFELFKSFGLDNSIEVKMYRHVDHELRGNKANYIANIEDLNSSGELEMFQSFQGSHVLGQGYLASFIGEENRLSRFIGMWRILDRTTGDTASKFSPDLEWSKFVKNSDYWYEMEKDHRFDALVDRLLIRWSNARGAHRWLLKDKKINNFEVHSIRAIGFSHDFPGFDELILKNTDLEILVSKGDGGAGWIEALRSTRGVYLITDRATGELYVGSATGADGIWGRWQDYGKNGHGGNLTLKKHCQSNPNFRAGLQFSILETLGNLATRKDGLVAEQRWKRKLGKKAIMLNVN